MVTNPAGRIAARYSTPFIDESNIAIKYEGRIDDAKRIRFELDSIIADEREKGGLSGISPLKFSFEQANGLRESIKSNERWQELYRELVADLAPGLDFEESKDALVGAISIPWWNENPLFLTEDHYRGNSLEVDAEITHPYIIQLMRNGALKSSKNTLSVSGVLSTGDGYLILGRRGGHSLQDTIMNIPAGYVKYRDSLFKTFRKESMEELDLDKEDILHTKLIGRVAGTGPETNTLYVFAGEMDLSFREAVNQWNTSVDRGEHKELIAVKNDFEGIVDYLVKNGCSSYETDRAAQTIGAYRVLPQATAALLLYCSFMADELQFQKIKRQFGNYAFDFENMVNYK